MCLVCKIFGHTYPTSDVAAEAQCTRCDHVRPRIVWPRMPVATSESTAVELTPLAFNLSVVESEIQSLDNMIMKVNRDITNANRRLNDLSRRRMVAKNRLHEMLKTVGR